MKGNGGSCLGQLPHPLFGSMADPLKVFNFTPVSWVVLCCGKTSFGPTFAMFGPIATVVINHASAMWKVAPPFVHLWRTL